MNQKFLITILFIGLIGFLSSAEADAASNTVLDFDGTSDYLVASDNAVFDQANRLSISVWIQPDDTPGGDEYIVYRFDDYYLKMDSSRKIIASVHTDAETMTSTSAITCDGSTWTHIEMTYDKDAGGTDEIKFYINGVLDAVGDYSTANAVSAELLYVGAADTDGLGAGVISNWFDGKIDDVRLYQYARSPSDVRLDYNEGLAVRMGGQHYENGSRSNCSTDPASCMDYGLAASYNMDEGGGTTLYDQSDNGNNGTLTNGPKWTTGHAVSGGHGRHGVSSGSALSFDGVNDYINCGNDSSLDITDAITIEAWVKMPAFPADRSHEILHKWSSDRYWGIAIHTDGDVQFITSSDGTAEGNVSVYTDALSVNDWYHITAVWDGSNMYIYKNGVEKNTNPQTAINTNSVDLEIGGYTTSSRFFSGSIDGVKIYNRALSAEEVRYHYNRGGPVAHWKFDEGDGAKAHDESGNRNHGTLTGSTSGTADSGSTTTLVDAALTQAEDFWNTYTLKIVTTTDALAPQGETATITGFAAGTDTLSFAALTAAVDANDTYKLYYGDENGPTWVAGHSTAGPGSALSFDGTDDYVDVADIGLQDEGTITFWFSSTVDLDSSDGRFSFIESNIGGVNNGDMRIGFAGSGNSSGAAVGSIFFLQHEDGGLYTVNSSSVSWTANIWHHVVAFWDGINMSIYIDGTHQETKASTKGCFGKTDIYIGFRQQDNNGFFNGSIDDVKIYNYTRTAEQILVDYNAGLAAHLK